MNQRRALLESNPPRNSQLETLEADERWEQATVAAPSLVNLVNSDIGSKEFPMPRKTHSESCRAAAYWLTASWASNSARGQVTQRQAQTRIATGSLEVSLDNADTGYRGWPPSPAGR